jgi:hypothetical protein
MIYRCREILTEEVLIGQISAFDYVEVPLVGNIFGFRQFVRGFQVIIRDGIFIHFPISIVEVFMKSCITGVKAFSGLPNSLPFVGSLGEFQICWGSFALAPNC